MRKAWTRNAAALCAAAPVRPAEPLAVLPQAGAYVASPPVARIEPPRRCPPASPREKRSMCTSTPKNRFPELVSKTRARNLSALYENDFIHTRQPKGERSMCIRALENR